MSDLSRTLLEIERHDLDYDVRYGLVLRALQLAIEVGYEAGIAVDAAEPEWPVVYIELPEGQCSWHLPAHPRVYDGHSTEEKYARIRRHADARERSGHD